jgi:hypothetical protein
MGMGWDIVNGGFLRTYSSDGGHDSGFQSSQLVNQVSLLVEMACS